MIMMRKKIMMLVVAAFLMVLMSMTAMADTWSWVDVSGDGVAQCYLFDDNGSIYTDCVTPDGYTVNENGEWTVDGVTMQMNVSNTEVSDTGSGLTYLCDLTPVSGGKMLQVNANTRTGEIWQRAYLFGGNHLTLPDSLTYYIGGQYNTLSFTYAPQIGNQQSYGVLHVYGDDDQELWRSEEIGPDSKPKEAVIDISGQQYITISHEFTGGLNSSVLVNDAAIQ